MHVMATLTMTRSPNQRGQAVIELALTLPLLLMVVFGIIDFGFMFQRYESVTNAAREGARLGVLQAAGYTATEAQNRAISYLQASGLNGTGPRLRCRGREELDVRPADDPDRHHSRGARHRRPSTKSG